MARRTRPTGTIIVIIILALLGIVLTVAVYRPAALGLPASDVSGVASDSPMSDVPAPDPPAAAPITVTPEAWRSMLCRTGATTTYSMPADGTQFRNGEIIGYAAQFVDLPAGHSVWELLLDMQTGTFLLFDTDPIIPSAGEPRTLRAEGQLRVTARNPGSYKLVHVMADAEADGYYSALSPDGDMVSQLNGIVPGGCALGGVGFVLTG